MCIRDKECNLDPAALAAMRHIVFSGDDKLFSFSLAAVSYTHLDVYKRQADDEPRSGANGTYQQQRGLSGS